MHTINQSPSDSPKRHYDSPELSMILCLTMKLCGKGNISIRRSSTAEKYWRRVMNLWKAHISEIGYNVAYAALYCIHWGTYPNDLPDSNNLRSLVDLVKSKFEVVSPDMQYAKSNKFFNRALNDVLISRSPHATSGTPWASEAFAQFLEAKTKCKIYGCKCTVKELNLLTTSIDDFKDLKGAALVRDQYERNKRALIKLIPSSATWSDDDFSNDTIIIQQLKSLYDIDYAKHYKCFDVLLYALSDMESDVKGALSLVTVQSMPNALATAIWPTDTNQHIVELFCMCYTTFRKYAAFSMAHGGGLSPNMVASRQVILDSWLGQRIEQLRCNHTLSDKATKYYLNLLLNIYN